MLWRTLCFYMCLSFGLCGSAFAHFGVLIPSQSMVMNKKEAALQLDIAFAHPFSRLGMPMQMPNEVFVVADGKKTALALATAEYMGQPAFKAEYRIERPGVCQFGVLPRPYYEKAEDCFIIHYVKTIVGAFGYDDGWDEPLGLPVEIVPLSRPFGNYSGNTFTGLALKNGKPLPDADVEIEFLNKDRDYEAPNSYFVTQNIKTDVNGQFTFGIPWPGWWGFAVLTESDEKLDHEGAPRDVELGGVIWLEFYAPQKRK